MRLYVGNIPRLADEEALTKWFERVGIRVESVRLMRQEERGTIRGFAWVKIADEAFPPKALRHLNQCTFWGQHLSVRKMHSETERESGTPAGAWVKPSAA